MMETGDRVVWPKGSILYELFRLLMVTGLKLAGWKIGGGLPNERKYVIIGAPHTSNWDFPIMLAIALYWRLPVQWLGKDALFKPAIVGVIMRKLGGIAIDRSKHNNVVAQMAEQFKQASEMVLLIPPEGTRGKTRHWKTGFYHIAHQGGVPLLLGYMDYENKEVGIRPEPFVPSGDYDADMIDIKAFYNTIKGKYPNQGQAN